MFSVAPLPLKIECMLLKYKLKMKTEALVHVIFNMHFKGGGGRFKGQAWFRGHTVEEAILLKRQVWHFSSRDHFL